MPDLLLPIPAESLESARIPPGRMEIELRKELALQLYREQLITGAAACRMAGIGKVDLQYLLGERGIPQQLSSNDLEKDLENWKEWENQK